MFLLGWLKSPRHFLCGNKTHTHKSPSNIIVFTMALFKVHFNSIQLNHQIGRLFICCFFHVQFNLKLLADNKNNIFSQVRHAVLCTAEENKRDVGFINELYIYIIWYCSMKICVQSGFTTTVYECRLNRMFDYNHINWLNLLKVIKWLNIKIAWRSMVIKLKRSYRLYVACRLMRFE